MPGMLFALALASAAQAQPVAEDRTEATKAEARTCKRLVPTGSMLPVKVCLTKAQWREFSNANQDDADATLRHRGTGMCDINCR